MLGLSLVSQVFFSCKKDEEKVTPPSSESGYFVVSSMSMSQASAPNGRIATVPSTTEFDLGSLRASKEYLFTITNGGAMPIFDVILTSNNAPFEITPKTIKTVPGKNQTGIMPLLTVGITHGRQLNGTAKAPVLAMGQNTATIKLRGKTISNQDTIEVTGEFKVLVDAKVFGVKFLSGGQTPTQNEFLAYKVSPSKGVTIVNTGNIKIHPRFEYGEYIWEVTGYKYIKTVNEFDLEPGEEKDITNFLAPIKYEGENTSYNDTYVHINDEGVVVATPGIPYAYDNIVYFSLRNDG